MSNNVVYYLASAIDPRYEKPTETPEEVCKCEACGDYSPLSNTLIIDAEFNYCLSCIRLGRLTKHVICDYPDDRIVEVLGLIKQFLISKLCM